MKFLGVDIGGTNIDIVLLSNLSFEPIATYSTNDYLENLSLLLKKLVTKLKVDAVGIGAAVWLRKGKQIKAPNLPFLIDVEDISTPVFLDNDANCFAIFAHEAFGFPNILAITVGTGIGSGIIANGRVYRGEGIAGEIGHWVVGNDEQCSCGGRGHLECYFSGWSLKEKYGREVKELMEDEEFIYLTEGFNVFCRVVANAVMLLDSTAVVFGGRMGMHFDEKKLEREIYRHLMPSFSPEIKILRDELAVAKGACLLAVSCLEQSFKS
jgi:glucokinase/N-acetylglucosamine kinase